MIKVDVKFNERNSTFEADELWSSSYLMLHICRKLRLWPSKVSFHEIDGTTLDRNKLVKDIVSTSNDVFKTDQTVNIIIKDLMTPDIEKNQEEQRKEMKSAVNVDISIMPQGTRLQKWVRPHETLASIVGALMLEGCLSQLIDIQHDSKSLLGRRSFQDEAMIKNGSLNGGEDPYNNPDGDLLLINDCGLRDGDHLDVVFPQIQNEDVNEHDMFEDDDASVYLNDQVNILIDSSDQQQPLRKRIQSSDSYLSILGDLLIDGFLKYRLVLSRGEEILLDTGENSSQSAQDKLDMRDRSPLRDGGLKSIKGESLVKRFDIKDNDSLELKFEKLDITKRKASQEKDRKGVITVEVLTDRSKMSEKNKISRIHVRPSDTVSTLARYLRRNPRSDEVDCVKYKGHDIIQAGVPLKDDKRLLIKDIGLVEDAKIHVFLSQKQQQATRNCEICIQCELPDQDAIQSFRIEHSSNPKGKEIIQFLTNKFKVKYKDICVWQEMVYPRTKFERIYYYEVESEKQPNTSDWKVMEEDSMKGSYSEQPLDLTQNCWKRFIHVDGDYSIKYPKGSVPIFHALIHVKHRRATTTGFHLLSGGQNSEKSSGLDNPTCLGYLQAIMIQDRVKNRHPTSFFVRTRNGFIDPENAKYVPKSKLVDPSAFPIPVNDREIHFVLLLLYDAAPAPRFMIPDNDNVCLWMKEGNMTCMSMGAFTNKSSMKTNSKINSWLYPFPFSFGTEKYYSDFLRGPLVTQKL